MALPDAFYSDKQLINMFQENNPLAWEKFYDRYAPVMFGLICSLTDSKLLAEQIFKNFFIHLKVKGTLLSIKHSLCATLMRHTYAYSIVHLKQLGINPKVADNSSEYKLIRLFTTQCDSITEAASTLTITETAVRERLHSEILALQLLYHTPLHARRV